MKIVFNPFLAEIPENVLKLKVEAVVELLIHQYGEAAYLAFDPEQEVSSPVLQHIDTEWIKRANCVGINVRTIGSFWNIVPYAFTLPAAQQAIHILPIWEPGVVASLYGMSSWNINPEFFSKELEQIFPTLNTVEKQLKVVINLLHLTGRVVGMDVVPHTDRYAEQVLANPHLFEWLQRRDDQIVHHESQLFEIAEALIFEVLQQAGSAVPGYEIPVSATDFYYNTDEESRLRMLFGEPGDYGGRLYRRKLMIQWLYEHGFETVPATMGPPYRGLEVDPDPAASAVDEEGRTWRDYRITRPQAMSRVFGPLARYRLYESKADNLNWELDFSRPVMDAWTYVCQQYSAIQEAYHFDFMRGDMSHVQMRPEGVPAEPDAYYDLLGAVKTTICARKPWFGYFAESFLAPPGEMAYGDEYDHLEASLADSTLGDLQSEPVGTDRFVQELARYVSLSETRKFAPNFTILTADKDDPRFDQFYLTGNQIRHFIALFLPSLPSYMALGFETRDIHTEPAPNEHYTKLYVFQVKDGPKSTAGPYQWGQNQELYQQLVRQKVFSEQVYERIATAPVRWLVRPDSTGERKYMVWEVAGMIFAANLECTKATETLIEAFEGIDDDKLQVLFSTASAENREFKKQSFVLLPGEGVILGIP